jgi:hypothetical protein
VRKGIGTPGHPAPDGKSCNPGHSPFAANPVVFAITTSREDPMAKSSADWQCFKEKFPQFAQSPALKADFEPALDELDGIEDALAKSAEAFCRETEHYFAKMENVRKMADAYKGIVGDLKKSCAGIGKDFDALYDRVFARGSIALEIADDVSARIARNRMRGY